VVALTNCPYYRRGVLTLQTGDGRLRVGAQLLGTLGADAAGCLQLIDLDREVAQLLDGVGSLAIRGEGLGIIDQLQQPGAFLFDLAARDGEGLGIRPQLGELPLAVTRRLGVDGGRVSERGDDEQHQRKRCEVASCGMCTRLGIPLGETLE
jgi:hypothetical protein